MMETAEIDIRAHDTHGARLALGGVFDLIEERRVTLDAQAASEGVPAPAARYAGPALVVRVVDVTADAAALADDEVRAHLEHVARHGARCGVVVELHGTTEAASKACAGSRGLLAALLDRRALRVIEPTAGVERPAVRLSPEPGEPGHLAALVRRGMAYPPEVDEATAGGYLDGMIAAAGAAGGAVAMAFLGMELRRTADMLDPEGGLITCPLCLPARRWRPDEIETHLVQTHAALARGGAQ